MRAPGQEHWRPAGHRRHPRLAQHRIGPRSTVAAAAVTLASTSTSAATRAPTHELHVHCRGRAHAQHCVHVWLRHLREADLHTATSAAEVGGRARKPQPPPTRLPTCHRRRRRRPLRRRHPRPHRSRLLARHVGAGSTACRRRRHLFPHLRSACPQNAPSSSGDRPAK
jgi:hypothetical protein